MNGPVTVQQAKALLAEGVLPVGGNMEIDLSGVSDVDTAALSLLFEWMRRAAARNCQHNFPHLPENLASLATLYGVLDLIPHSSH